MTKLIRYSLGTILIISGFVKLNDPLGFAYKLEEYYSADVLDIPFLMKYVTANGFMVSLVEVILGLAIIYGLKISQTLIVSIAMFLFFGFLTFYSAYFNKVTDCGCFGDAVHFTPWQSFSKDMLLLAMTIFLWFKKRKILPKKNASIIISTGIILSSSVALYAINNIPLIDFRPYKIGANITELMNIPDNATKDIYEDLWVYKVDGNNVDFKTDDAPWDIKGAEFVSRSTKLISKGYEPPIHDFSLIKEDTDYTNKILSEKEVVCIISLKVSEINDGEIESLKNLISSNKRVILISPISDNTIDDFFNKIGKTIEHYTIDDTTCKTIIRSNPGIIVLKEGVITEKYSL